MSAHRKSLLTILSPLLALLLCGAGYVPETPPQDLVCRLHHRVDEFASLRELPSWLRDFLKHTPGEMADRGGKFNSTDVIVGDYPSRRFLRAGHSGSIWFFWYEQGGIAYSKNILIIGGPRGYGQANLIAKQSYYRENPCPLTDALLDRAT